jgi:hypothetical protein
LSGDPGNRLILGVSSTQVSSGSNVFDIEDTSSWTHMMELRADGSAMFRGNVTLDNRSNTTTMVSGFWYQNKQNTYPGGTDLGQAVCTTYPDGFVCQLPNGQYKNGDIGYIKRASWGYEHCNPPDQPCASYSYDVYQYHTKPEILNNVNTATVKAGAFMDNNGPVGPSGSWCGMGFGDWHIKCDGMDVIKQGCPVGYTQVTFGKASNAGDWANDLVTCFKN